MLTHCPTSNCVNDCNMTRALAADIRGTRLGKVWHGIRKKGAVSLLSEASDKRDEHHNQ